MDIRFASDKVECINEPYGRLHAKNAPLGGVLGIMVTNFDILHFVTKSLIVGFLSEGLIPPRFHSQNH
jgi:hypothetical protein